LPLFDGVYCGTAGRWGIPGNSKEEEMKIANPQLTLTLAILALAGLAPCAAAQQQAIISNGRTIVPNHGSAPRTSARPGKDSSLVTIFDNIGTAYPKGTFWCCEGATISGPDTPGQFEWWDGAAFTPSANYTVTEIGLALGYISGANQVEVHLNQDSSGVPGTALRTWTVQNIPGAGTCCTVTTLYDTTGVPVTSGVQYWVTVTTNENDKNVQAVWDVNDTDQIDAAPGAARCQGPLCRGTGTWQSFTTTPGLAFQVFGK
jgi:hypothetical protein